MQSALLVLRLVLAAVFLVAAVGRQGGRSDRHPPLAGELRRSSRARAHSTHDDLEVTR
jgi:hypothetical protein